MVKISNIILGYRQDPSILEASIESSLNQEKTDFEIIFVNNSGLPPPNKIVEKYEKNIQIVNTKDLSRGMARNEGAKKACGEILVFLDGDTIVCNQNSFQNIEKCSINYSHGYGAQRYWTYPLELFERSAENYLKAIKEQNFEWLLDKKRAVLPKGIDRTSGYRDLQEFSFPANFGFFRRKLFESVGGFNSLFQGYGGEDDYLGFLCYLNDPNGFKLLNDFSVLHVTHPLPQGRNSGWSNADKNYCLLQELISREGYTSFNLNVLFGINEEDNEKVLERENGKI